MKNSVLLVACIVLLSSLAVLANQSSFTPKDCCFQLIGSKLPTNRVVSYKHTHVQCSKKAVLFTMKKGARICADPSMEWVKEIISAVDKRTTN